MSRDRIVTDVEIKVPVEELPGRWEDTHEMGVASAVVWEERGNKVKVYTEQDVEALKTRLLEADRIDTFNGWRFDFPVIWGYRRASVVEELRSKSNDLLRRIWEALGLDPDEYTRDHGGYRLDSVARATLGRNRGKSGNGAEAPHLARRGEWGKLITYNGDDVFLTRDLADFVDLHGYVIDPKRGSRIFLPDLQP